MMISSENFSEDLQDESYEALIKERDSLIREIRHFEKNRDKILGKEIVICPSPEVVYQMNLQYLAVVCNLISSKYNDLINGCN